jgi:hypothetical protein
MPKVFISHKKVTATPMNRLAYNRYRGWNLPIDEVGTDEGYLVEYLDGGVSNHPDHKGYISWSPKEQFDNGYTEVTNSNLTFGQAIEAAKEGKRIARTGWNGADMFAYYVPAAKYKACTSVMMELAYDNDLIPYREYLALKTAQGDVATWAPSVSDALASDWFLVE